MVLVEKASLVTLIRFFFLIHHLFTLLKYYFILLIAFRYCSLQSIFYHIASREKLHVQFIN